MVTASLTTPAIVTVTALVTEIRTYSVNTCNKEIEKFENWFNGWKELKATDRVKELESHTINITR